MHVQVVDNTSFWQKVTYLRDIYKSEVLFDIQNRMKILQLIQIEI